jgi:hypothetical protein
VSVVSASATSSAAQANQRYHARQNLGGGASRSAGLSGISRTNAAQPTAQANA